MVKVLSCSWIPRSYGHVHQTFKNIDKAGLKLGGRAYGREASFEILDYLGYPHIKFVQDWSGLHYFVVELSEENIQNTAIKFMNDTRSVLLEKIIKSCHTVSYNQIKSDILPLDFHTIVLSGKDLNSITLPKKKVGDLVVYYDPKDFYESNTLSFVCGTEDESLFRVLLFHAYTEVACNFISHTQSKIIRLYHEATSNIEETEKTKDPTKMSDLVVQVEKLMRESSESYGKLKQAKRNFELKSEEYAKQKFTQQEKSIAEAFEIGEAFRKLSCDIEYNEVLWSDVLIEYLRNINSILNTRILSSTAGTKKGLFG